MKRIDENHSFNINVACIVGERKAILLKEQYGWCLKNLHNEKNIHHGHAWTYNSARAYAQKFPYWSEKSIGRWLKELEEDGWVAAANLNKISFDRTKWYTVNFRRYDLAVTGCEMSAEDVKEWKDKMRNCIPQNEESNSHNEESDSSKSGNEISHNEEPIPPLSTSSSSLEPERENALAKNEHQPNGSTPTPPPDSATPPSPKRSRFVRPEVSEMIEYMEDLFLNESWRPRFISNPDETAAQIHDYYTANGWKVGRNAMKDWKAACRNWLKNNEKYAPKYRPNVSRTSPQQQPQPLVSEETHRRALARTLAALGVTGGGS